MCLLIPLFYVVVIPLRNDQICFYHTLCTTVVEDLVRSPLVDHRAEVMTMCKTVFPVVSTYALHSSTRAFAMQITEAMVAFLKGMSVPVFIFISKRVSCLFVN